MLLDKINKIIELELNEYSKTLIEKYVKEITRDLENKKLEIIRRVFDDLIIKEEIGEYKTSFTFTLNK